MAYEKQSHILFGGDYNPDQWNDDIIEKDMELFKKAGINTVSLPMFSWTRLEPKENDYQLDWLDHVLDILDKNMISYFLATPTCAQPAWMSKKYPEILPVDIAGRKRTHGMRVFFCINSEKYRERAAAIAKVMADHYKDREGLVGWHVANEYGTYCYCENCQKKFRIWLQKRYKTLENLNDKWNTAFWNRTIMDYDEIMLPTELNDDYRFNPAVQLDYMRFITDSTISCYENEASILKNATPKLPVFTNISGLIKKINQFEMVAHMDLAGWDNYPGPEDEKSFPALKHDIMRACKDGESYYVMEQSPNQQNWQPYNKIKKPGELRRIAYQGMAHGADSSLYFQMRQSIGGQEKFHGAVISHNGRSDTRIFKEIEVIGEELKKAGDQFVGGKIEAEVAIVFDWENWWSLELSSGPSQDLDYLREIHHYYKPFYQMNVPIDIIKTTTELSKYKIVIAPMLYMQKDNIAEKLDAFVQQGGTLVATYMTGYTDENDRCKTGASPGKLQNALGIWVEETDALLPEEHNSIHMLNEGMEHYESSFLCDLIHAESAEIIAVYEKDFYKGYPAITRNSYYAGQAYYIATRLEDSFLENFLDKICKKCEVKSLFESKGEIEITKRENEKGETWFVINHGTKEGWVDLRNLKYKNIVNDRIYTGKVRIAESEVLMLKQK